MVDENGFTNVNINFQSDEEFGSTWVFVPKFQEWTNHTIRGEVTSFSISETTNFTNTEFSFYDVLSLTFSSDPVFEINIQFNFSTAGMIIEPNGMFFSPQIGFESGSELKTEVKLPQGFSVNEGEVAAFGITRILPNSVSSNSNFILFDNFSDMENLVRIQIGFKTSNDTQDLITVKEGLFTFETVKRYQEYAYEMLDLYNKAYDDLVDFFNVTLEETQIKFFLPDYDSLLTIGGFVPISGEDLSDIHINIVFTRYVKGYIEVIALHELIHHFLWKAGISPLTLLWFHEGMAQYLSIEEASNLGFEGANIMEQDLEEGVNSLRLKANSDLAFLKEWTPSNQPSNINNLYVTAYYVVSRLSASFNGSDYYSNVFKKLRGQKIDDYLDLSYYLNLETNDSAIRILNEWNFGIPTSSTLYYFEKLLNGVPPLFKPFNFLTERFYEEALSESVKNPFLSTQYLVAAILLSFSSLVLTLITIIGILFGITILILKNEGIFQN
jgi:hypothetical protein